MIFLVHVVMLRIHSLINSGYFYDASSSPLPLGGAPDYRIDTMSELTRRSVTGSCEWRTCSRSLELDSNLHRPSGRKAPNLPLSHRAPLEYIEGLWEILALWSCCYTVNKTE